MYVAWSQLLFLWDLEEQRGKEFKVMILRETGGESQKRGTIFAES